MISQASNPSDAQLPRNQLNVARARRAAREAGDPATGLHPSDFRQFSPHCDVLCWMPGDRRIYVHCTDAVSLDHCIER